MALIGDSTDLEGTKRPNEDSISDSADVFHPVIVVERPSKPNLPTNISPTDAYGIFSLFFTTDILETIAKNTNKYAALHGADQSKPPSQTRKTPTTPWRNTSARELRAYLGVLIYRSLYPQARRYSYWAINANQPIHEALAASIGRDRFAELEVNLHISDPDLKGDCFSKLKPLNSHLLKVC